MRHSGFLASVIKEARLLSRDLHGLALLFVLPTVFILIMSLALQDRFGEPGEGLSVHVIDADGTDASRDFIRRISGNAAFSISPAPDGETPDGLRKRVEGGEPQFGVVVPAGYAESLQRSVSPAALDPAKSEEIRPAELIAFVAPDADRRMEAIFVSMLNEGAGRQQADAMLARLRPRPAQEGAEPADPAPAARVVLRHAWSSAAQDSAPPSSVQQSVPAWLVFSIFFVAIPFSNTYIRERELGVLRRLRTTRLSAVSHGLGKLVPYFVVNQAQVWLMLAVGAWLVPLLGGDALELRGSPLALALMGASVSVAALGLALLVSAVARTTEQATLMSGLGNIVLAAIGGIMIPRFLMPDAMQALSQASPMAWGLDGFLQLLLHGGSVPDMIREAAKLVCLGVAATALALALQTRQE